MKGLVFNLQKFSIHDGPGIRTTVFLKGCPLRCAWCANPESQNAYEELVWNEEACQDCGRCETIAPDIRAKRAQKLSKDWRACITSCPAGALTVEGEYKDSEEILAYCLDDMPFYEESGGGVTISGGEGFTQPDFLRELVESLKREGVHVAIETTGHVSKETFTSLAPLFDLLLYDVKHYESQAHQEGTGVVNELILENLKWVVDNGLDVLVRIPVIPGFNDSIEDAHRFGKLLSEIGVERVECLPFHQFGEGKYEKLYREYAYRGVPAISAEDLRDYKEVLRSSGLEVL